jgi:acyl carrier protein
MSSAEIIEKTNQYLVDEFEVDAKAITPEGNVKEVLELDSLDYVDLVVILESNFGFKVKQEDFIGIATFADLYKYIESKTASA